jgi:hypothetical protein
MLHTLAVRKRFIMNNTANFRKDLGHEASVSAVNHGCCREIGGPRGNPLLISGYLTEPFVIGRENKDYTPV